MKTNIFRVALLSCYCFLSTAQDVEPGVERWTVKTTLQSSSNKKTVTLTKLLALPDPIGNRKEAADDAVIKKAVGGLKEGDIITTKGYIHLIALERDAAKHRDGDYHIQMRTTGAWGDTCFVIEVPNPTFIDDASLKKKCEKVREFVRTNLLKGKEPGTSGNVMKNEVYVSVTGQLFFDAAHLGGSPRGKKGSGPSPMHSYTCWELHPITNMEFAPKSH